MSDDEGEEEEEDDSKGGGFFFPLVSSSDDELTDELSLLFESDSVGGDVGEPESELEEASLF